MSSRRALLFWYGLLFISTLAFACPPGASVRAAESSAATDARRQQWSSGLELVTSGQFDEGAKLIDQALSAGLNDPRARRVHDWLESFQEIEADRASRRQADYEQYAQWVQEDIAAGKWLRAITTCTLAFQTSLDQDAFRNEPWVQEAIKGALEAARGYEAEHEWYKAGRIYAYIERMFPKETEYRNASERVQDHLTLKLSYSEDADWETAVSNITPLMAIQAFKRIETHYFGTLSVEKCILSALQRMLYMVEEPSLVETFPNLGNTGDVEEFKARIRALQVRTDDQQYDDMADLILIFDQVLRINKELDLFNQEVLIREFVQGALQPLDPFSDMLWPAETEEFNKHTQGRFTGVGISIRKPRGEPIQVISPLEDTPAYKAGIRPGDMITHIDGKSAAPLSITAAVRMITGPTDTKVTLTIKRPSAPQDFDVTLTRAEITIHTIKGYQRADDGRWDYLIDPDLGIAYIRVTNFSEETSLELASTLRQLTDEQNVRGLLLDLRGNPGGLLKAAVDVASLFLPGDKLVVSTRDGEGEDFQIFTSPPNGENFTALPLVILIDGGSASASEIVSGALQDHKRARTIGERTFGKGSVQQVLHVTPSRSAFLKLTTARYFLPNGRSLHHDEDSETWGVDPDVEVKLVPKEYEKVLSMRVRRDILRGVDQDDLSDEELDKVLGTQPDTPDETDTPPSTQPSSADSDSEDADEDEERMRDDPNDYPEIDPQLEAALLLMRVHLETDVPWWQEQTELAAHSHFRTSP